MTVHRGRRAASRSTGACALVLAASLTAPGPVGAASSDRPVDAASIDATVRAYRDAVAVPGVAVAVTHGDRVVLTRGYGRAPDGEAIHEHTPMAVASVSKSFTALAVMQLVDAGEVDLDRPVRVYLPEFTMADPRVEQVTVRQLLNHTSGLSDRTFPAFSGPQPRTLAERVASLRTAALGAAPGTTWEYHNPNYQLAARLVERVSGASFDGYLRQRVFGPLGMRDSRTIDTADDLPPSARGHLRILGRPLAVPEPRAFGAGSGGVLSSAHDMAAWLVMQHRLGRAPNGTAIVSAAAIASMRTPSPLARSHGFGWVVGKTPSGSALIAHSGDLFTSTAQQLLLTESGWGVAVMANTGLAYGDARAIAARIVAVIERADAEAPAAWSYVALDAVMLGWAAVMLALGAAGVRRSRAWATRRIGPARRVAGLVLLLVPALLCVTIHRVVGFLYRGRDVAWIQVPYVFPTFMVLLAAASLAGLVVFGVRVARVAARPAAAAR